MFSAVLQLLLTITHISPLRDKEKFAFYSCDGDPLGSPLNDALLVPSSDDGSGEWDASDGGLGWVVVDVHFMVVVGR